MGNKEIVAKAEENSEVVETPLLVPLSRILEFIQSSEDFFHLYLLSRNTKNFIEQNPRFCKNVQFQILRSVPEKTLTGPKPFVIRLKVFISYRDNFSPDYLALFANVEYLELNLVSGLAGEGFDRLRNLKELRLSRCERMTDILFGKVPKKLETLSISGCRWITCQGLQNNLKDLKALSILDNKHVKDNNLESCTKLESLELVNCRLLTDQAILFAAIDNPNLGRLTVHVNDNFTDTVFLSCKSLRSLDLERLKQISNPPLEGLTNLVKLRLAGCDSISDCTLPSSLEEVEVKGCSNLENKCFFGLRQLRKLVVVENMSLGQTLFRDLKKLESLTILDCSETIIGHVMKGLVRLKEVWLQETDIHDEIIKHWKDVEVLVLKKCPRVTGLEILKMKKLREVEIEECIGVEASVFRTLEESTVVIRESVLDIRPSVMDFMGYQYTGN